jgi:hypothetical protein
MTEDMRPGSDDQVPEPAPDRAKRKTPSRRSPARTSAAEEVPAATRARATRTSRAVKAAPADAEVPAVVDEVVSKAAEDPGRADADPRGSHAGVVDRPDADPDHRHR